MMMPKVIAAAKPYSSGTESRLFDTVARWVESEVLSVRYSFVVLFMSMICCKVMLVYYLII
jgi:hypothetical protein